MGVEEGIFEPQGFFSYKIPFMNIILGLIGVQEFFSFNFPLRENFFSLPPTTPPPAISFLMVRPLPR